MSVQERREHINQQITLWIGNKRLDAALAAEELGQYSGMQKALLLRNGLLVGAVRHCRINPRADTRMSILTLITFLSDNNDGICRLSVTRMCEIFARSRESIVSSISSLERDGQIGVNRSGGMPNCYWPLIPAALAELSANPVWFVDALSTKPKFRVFGSPEQAIAVAAQSRSTLPDQSTAPDQSSGPDHHRSTPVDEPVNSSRRTGQEASSSISLSNSASDLKGQAAPNGQAQMAEAFGGEAAFAARNIKVEKGRIIIGDELRTMLRGEGNTDADIDLALPRALERANGSTDPLRILPRIRWALSYVHQNAKGASKGSGKPKLSRW